MTSLARDPREDLTDLGIFGGPRLECRHESAVGLAHAALRSVLDGDVQHGALRRGIDVERGDTAVDSLRRA